MSWVVRIFWNAQERRLRALWRRAIQGAAWFLILSIGQIGVAVIVAASGLASGALTPESLANPAAVQEMILSLPGLVLALQAVSFAATLLTVWLAGRLLDKRPFAGFGFHLNQDWWIDFGFGLALGAALMLVIFLVELTAGWVTVQGTFMTHRPGMSFAGGILAALVTFVLVGISEELFFRGYQLRNWAEGLHFGSLGPRAAILIAMLLSSILFGVLHTGNPNANLASTLNLFLAGLFLALGYVLTGELAIPIGLHITWNFFQGQVFGFPVSGLDIRSAAFIVIEQYGPDIWTGGPFGPEGGLVGVGAMLLGSLLVVLWVRVRYGEARLCPALASPPGREAAPGEVARAQP